MSSSAISGTSASSCAIWTSAELDRLVIGRRAVAVAGELPRDARARDQVARESGIERRQGDGPVADQFHRGAALTEQDDRAEYGVGRSRRRSARSACGRRTMRCTVKPEQPRRRARSVRACSSMRRGGVAHHRRRLQIERNAAHIGFVR